MSSLNFRALLLTITIEQLKAYLGSDGWTANILDGRLNFTKEIVPGEPQTLFVPADQTHPKFRSLLQNLMFSMSVIQKREPAEIASDIASVQIELQIEYAEINEQVHDIASIIRGLAQECVETDRAKGKILELARFLLNTQSLTITLTPKLAEELWEVARGDDAYLPASTTLWLEANTKRLSSN